MKPKKDNDAKKAKKKKMQANAFMSLWTNIRPLDRQTLTIIYSKFLVRNASSSLALGHITA